jgi:Skp family chaperone for outer membrane proteins
VGSLAELPNLVGFFSYSREDDEDSGEKLSALRDAIGRELAQQLGRSKRKDFRLWQDQVAIEAGDDWESEIAKAIGQSAFFIPIVTPRAVASKHCKFEFESFLARERALGRDDLIFPILYLSVPALLDEANWRVDPVLSIVGRRQHFDWRRFRHVAPETTVYGEAIETLGEQIVGKLRQPWVSPEERRQLEAEAARRAEEADRIRQEAEAKRKAEKEEERLRLDDLAKQRAEQQFKREIKLSQRTAMLESLKSKIAKNRVAIAMIVICFTALATMSIIHRSSAGCLRDLAADGYSWVGCK